VRDESAEGGALDDAAAPDGVAAPDGLAAVCRRIAPPDRFTARRAEVWQRTLARPIGSLGRLDDLVRTIAGIRRDARPGPLPAAVSILAGDHGVAAHGVSAFRHGLTHHVLELIASGRAPVNILADRVPAKVVTADFGLATSGRGGAAPTGDQAYKVACGTADISRQDAMTIEQARRAIAGGVAFTNERLGDEPLLAVGEIGVGNTTAAAALTARLLGTPPAQVVGAGSGVDAAVVERKRDLVAAAVRRTRGLPDDPVGLLAALGGFEIAGNVGVILAAAGQRRVIVLDGYITAVAALIAVRLCRPVAGYLIASHLSTEPGHQVLLDTLGLSPLLSLGMRLGMASGATLALGMVNAALAVAALTPGARSVGLTLTDAR
jgi:nicotinate-nucleotide--dimethylbenzimidazole phosphoribosyltransferase